MRQLPAAVPRLLSRGAVACCLAALRTGALPAQDHARLPVPLSCGTALRDEGACAQ